MWNQEDHKWMQQAIELATLGEYTTRANPNVGCVIVKDGACVAQGYHQRLGGDHAEIAALKAAGANAQGATMYITLEPCTHSGRTDPCVLSIVKAGIKEVIFACADPNPLVQTSKYKNFLQEHQITVRSGLLAEQARNLNLDFFKQMLHKKPYIRLKLACSLDGKTALNNNQSKWITGTQARIDVQRWRAKANAILTSAATIIADDPQLSLRTAQLSAAEQQQLANPVLPTTVILDTNARLDPSYKIFAQPQPVILLTAVNQDYKANFPKHVTIHKIKRSPKGLCLTTAINLLQELQLTNVMVEAGAKLAGSLLEAKLCDELILYTAPILLGGAAKNLIDISEITNMQDAIKLRPTSSKTIGLDVRQTFQLHPTSYYQEPSHAK